jgi:hypothetical protein
MNQENEEHRTEEQPEQHDEGAATEPVPGKMVDGDEPEANASSESEEPVDSSPDPQAGVSEEDSGSPEENREPEPVEQPVSDSEDESGEGSPTEEPAQVPTEAEPTAPEEPGTREEDASAQNR